MPSYYMTAAQADKKQIAGLPVEASTAREAKSKVAAMLRVAGFKSVKVYYTDRRINKPQVSLDFLSPDLEVKLRAAGFDF